MRRFTKHKQVKDANREIPSILRSEGHSAATRQDTPVLSAYLARLGEQAAKQGEPVPSAKSTEQRSHDSHPIGDRRMRVPSLSFVPVETPEKSVPFYVRLTLGAWSYYFVAKLVLYGLGLISFHAPENMAFAVFIVLPPRGGFWGRLKSFATLVSAVVLLYYDSWLPDISRLMSKASLLSDFRPDYLFELSTRFVSWQVVAALLLAWMCYWLASRWLRMGVLVVACMMFLWIQGLVGHSIGQVFEDKSVDAAPDKPDMDTVVNDFFDQEVLRSVSFTPPPANAVPFDVIFIHVCSLSWDDVVATGLDQHPLWQRFDFLLTRFNSAATYSGPAAIHLLRATCGQQKHDNMYLPVPEKCYLMDSLKDSGFEPDFALNHNGKFDHFLEQVRTHGHLTAPLLNLDGLQPTQYSFIESPVYDDLSVLNRWLTQRQQSSRSRVALYYNTASLHDGNHMPGQEALPNTLKTYKTRLSRFLDETDAFMQNLEKSGRRAVVVLVPEHGGAVRGDHRQIAGLREIPTPSIAIVPVGIKVIGAQRQGEPLEINQQTSFLAISQIIEHMLEKSPYARGGFLPSGYVADLPVTPFVAQNEKMTVAEYKGHYYFSRGFGGWEDYSEFNSGSP